MFTLFLVFICVSVRLEVSGAREPADERFYQLVMEGQFTMKCEEMYGQPLATNVTGIKETLRPYKCENECQECLMPLNKFGSIEALTDCVAECNKTGHGDPCNQGCHFFHRVVNSGDRPNGTWYDTRSVTSKGPYLFCRTYTELLVNLEFRLVTEDADVEPVAFISFYRFNENDPWNMMHSLSSELPIHLPQLTKGLTVQLSVAIVTSKGLQVQPHSKEFRHVGEWMGTLSDDDLLDPPKDIQVNIRKAGDTFEGHLTWRLAPQSKTCDYRIYWRAADADHSESRAFALDRNKHHLSTKLHYVLNGLMPRDNYTIVVISVTSDDKESKLSTVYIVTPSLVLGPPENLTLVNVTHLSHNTSTAIVTWRPPYNISSTDHVQEYRLSWRKIPILSKPTSEVHKNETKLPPENTTFQLVGLHNGFPYIFKVAAVSSTTGEGEKAKLVFNTSEPQTKFTEYGGQSAPIAVTKTSPFLRLVTGLVVAAVCASFVGLMYAFIKNKYGSMSLAVRHLRSRYHGERQPVEVNLM